MDPLFDGTEEKEETDDGKTISFEWNFEFHFEPSTVIFFYI